MMGYFIASVAIVIAGGAFLIWYAQDGDKP